MTIEDLEYNKLVSYNSSFIFNNASDAFSSLYTLISENGIDYAGTKAFMNCNILLLNPLDRTIDFKWRNWKPDYAEREWAWYMSANPSVEELENYASTWKRMHGPDNYIVQSNYGFLWNENDQLNKCIKELKNNPESRRASISLFDGKRKDQYELDTPCTFAVTFIIQDNKLNMSVQMRSNDLWYGFCNDQYCFSKLQEYVAKKLDMPVGWYNHFDVNLHIYNDKLNKKK